MADININEIVKILLEDSFFVSNLWEFSHHLNASSASKGSLRQRLSMGSINATDCLTELLEEWVGKNGKKASIVAISQILQKMLCINAKELLEKKYRKPNKRCGSGSPGKLPPPKKSARQPFQRNVASSEELSAALQLWKEGDIIKLAEGVYEGDFKIAKDKVTLEGCGEGTKLLLDYDDVFSFVEANDCVLKNMSILIDSFFTVTIQGKNNLLSNVEFRCNRDCKFVVVVDGNNNKFDNCSMEEGTLKVSGVGNKFFNLQLVGKHATLKLKGKESLVAGCKGAGKLELTSYSTKNTVRSCNVAAVRVGGSNHSLTKVVATEAINVSGQGAKLIECKAQQLYRPNYSNVKVIDCDFKTLESGENSEDSGEDY